MILDLLDDFGAGKSGASEEKIRRAESRLTVRFPEDLRQILRRSNGGIWYIGDRYVHVWDTQRIEAYNKARPVRVPVPGLVGIAHDMVTETCYALDYRPGSAVGVVEIPLPALAPIRACGDSFSACLLRWYYEGIERAYFDHVCRGSAPGALDLLRMLPSWSHHPGSSPDQIVEIESVLGVVFPDDYKTVVQWADGFDCMAGRQYLRVWSVGTLVQENRDYEVARYMPGAIMIGSDAGDRCFALYYEAPGQQPRVISCDLGGLDLDEAEACGSSLTACLQDWSGIRRAALAGGRAKLLRCLAARQ